MIPLDVERQRPFERLRELRDLIAVLERSALSFDSCSGWVELYEERAETDAGRPAVVKKKLENCAALVGENLSGICGVVRIGQLTPAKIARLAEVHNHVG